MLRRWLTTRSTAGERAAGAAAAPTLPASMRGRVCMVTGATSGHGRAVAHGLAELGAELVLLGRDPARCRQVAAEIARHGGPEPEILLCDLSSLEQVRAAARRWLQAGRPLHLLVNNAGLVNMQRRLTHDGFELTFGVNYLAHFALTALLLERMTDTAAGEPAGARRECRIVNVSSDTHRVVQLDLADLQSERRYSWLRAYGRSKLALLYFTAELARRLHGSGVTVNAVDPGPVDSRIGMNHDGMAPHLLAVVMKLFFPSPRRAARTALQLAAAPELEGISGAYYKFGRRRTPRLSQDATIGPRLWELSAALCAADVAPAPAVRS